MSLVFNSYLQNDTNSLNKWTYCQILTIFNGQGGATTLPHVNPNYLELRETNVIKRDLLKRQGWRMGKQMGAFNKLP